MSDERIEPGAFGDLPKKVPVVHYGPNGERTIIGEGTIDVVDGALRLEGRITDPKARDILGFSVGPGDVSVVEDPKFPTANPPKVHPRERDWKKGLVDESAD